MGVYYDPSYGKIRANEQELEDAMYGYFKVKPGTFDENQVGDLNGDGVLEVGIAMPYFEVTPNPAGNQIKFAP